MLTTREDQVGQVLEDKKVYDPLIHSANEPVKERTKKFKSFKCASEGLSKSNCTHYALDSNAILSTSDIHSKISIHLEKGEFQVSRIQKPCSSYVRLSINNQIGIDTREKVFKSLKIFLGVKTRELKMRPNLDLKDQVKETESDFSILTLNINNLRNKVEELDERIQKEKPSVICLQETGRRNVDKKIFFAGYSVDEMPLNEKGRGLLIGVRKDIDFAPKVIIKTDNVIALAVKNNGNKIIVINVYRPNKGPERKTVIQTVGEIFKRVEDKDCKVIAVGDWNTEPETVMNQLFKAGVTTFASHAPSKGTRIKRNRRRTKKVIDFGIASSSDCIESQTRKRCWNLSDHVPILVRLEENQIIRKPPVKRTIFDKKTPL